MLKAKRNSTKSNYFVVDVNKGDSKYIPYQSFPLFIRRNTSSTISDWRLSSRKMARKRSVSITLKLVAIFLFMYWMFSPLLEDRTTAHHGRRSVRNLEKTRHHQQENVVPIYKDIQDHRVVHDSIEDDKESEEDDDVDPDKGVKEDEKGLKFLEVGVLDENQIADNKNVFFIEVKRTDSSPETFNGRFLCAFESAAKHHPDKDVYVLIEQESSIHLFPEYFRKFGNIKFLKTDFDHLAQNTPATNLWNRGDVKNCAYSFYNKGNYLRFALMLKHGGHYMDTDVVTVKSFPDIPNFAIAEGLEGIASAVIKFQKGHPFIKRVMENMQADFQGDRWGYNGPHLIARTALEVCNGTDTHKHANNWKCHGFPILKQASAFPIPGFRWKYFYQTHMANFVQEALKESYAVHYWNHASKLLTKKEEVNKDYPLYEIFKNNCPITEQHVLQYEKLF